MRASPAVVRVVGLAMVWPLALLTGCRGDPPPPSAPEGEFSRNAPFGPASMRIHPIFSQVKDWTGDGNADGVEVLVEFLDQFNDPCKAQGRVMFEMYEFRRGPDPRGRRVVNPWVGSLRTIDDQRAHWNRTSRTYTFQLAHPQIDPRRTHVMTATFERAGGGRFFDRVILEGTRPEPRPAPPAPPSATGPATRP